MDSTSQFGQMNLTRDEGVEHAMSDAFQHVAQGLVRVQEALRLQEERTAQRIQEALLHHEATSTTAMREALRRVEQKLQERDDAVSALELRLTAQIASLEERMSVLEERMIPFGDRTGIAKAGSYRISEQFETRLKNLEMSVQKALDCVFPRVDALLAHLQKPSPPRVSCTLPSSFAASVCVSSSCPVPSISTSTSTSACASVISTSTPDSTTVTASHSQRPVSIAFEATESGSVDVSGGSVDVAGGSVDVTGGSVDVTGGQLIKDTDHQCAPTDTDHQCADSDEECEKQVVDFRVQEIVAMRHNASAGSSRLGEKLCWAVSEADLHYVRNLLDYGADVNYTATQGDSPLISALSCKEPKPNVVSILLERGADANSIDVDGMSPLHHAAINDHKCLCLPLLIRAGANLNARDKEGETPLHWAAAKNNEGAVRALVAAGARKDLQGWSGRWKNLTPFDIAVSDVLQKLLRQ